MIGRDLTTDGFYRLDDPTHSIIDPQRQEAYQRSSDPVKKTGKAIVEAADAFRKTGSRAAARCVIDRIFQLAQAGSLTGSMSSNQAFYVQGWVAGAIAIAYLKVRDSGLASPQENSAIAAWLLQIDGQTRGYYDHRRQSSDGQNNHFYWAGLESAAIGTVANDSNAFMWGVRAYKEGTGSIRPDGTLPLEMKRGARALHYHLYALAPLVLLAEFGSANGIDLYAEHDGAIHRLVRKSISGLMDPGPFEKATGVPQEVSKVPGGDQIGWAPPYLRRFPDANATRMVTGAANLSVYYLGGLPPP